MNRSLFTAAACLALTWTALQTEAQTNCRLTGDPVYTNVSGYTAATSELSLPRGDFHALQNIENLENNGRRDLNRPCRTTAEFARFPNAVGARPMVERFFDDCTGNRRGDRIRVRSNFDAGYIGSLRACTSGQNNTNRRRLKGMAVTYRTIDPQTCEVRPLEIAFGDGTFRLTSTRNRCSAWQPTQTCPADHVATGVVVHSRDRGVSGMQLVCRRVTTR